ncbi:MAG TPA: hypothetical protein VIV11_25365 [Kofleriaceae bacterium]
MIRHHVLVAALLVSCKQPARDVQFDDPAQASERVKALVSSCEGVTRALDQLARARVNGRLLAGLVDDAIAAAQCNDVTGAVKGKAAAHQLARARLDDAKPDAALLYLTDTHDVAVRYRRAELFDRLGRSAEAARELDGIVLDHEAQALQRMLLVSVAARAGKSVEAARLIDAAPLPDRPRLAHRAVSDAPVDVLAPLAQAGQLELALAVADRLEPLQGPAAVLSAREVIAAKEPTVAEHWDALGRSRIAAGKVAEALEAWDRAIELAPAQPTFRLAPIRALMIAGDPKRARARAESLGKQAMKAGDVELLVTASAGAAAVGEGKLAIELARAARAKRTTDGRLAFLVAQRLAEAGEARAAADAYVELLVCGAHGRAWHRHEVAGKLFALAKTDAPIVRAALDAKRSCTVVEPDDLTQYVTPLRR